MVNYKDLGLVNTRDMFAKAIKGGYRLLSNSTSISVWLTPSLAIFSSI